MSERWATSSRNAWATSSESALIAPLRCRNIGLTASTLFSPRPMAVAYPRYQQRHPVRVPVRELVTTARLLPAVPLGCCLGMRDQDSIKPRPSVGGPQEGQGRARPCLGLTSRKKPTPASAAPFRAAATGRRWSTDLSGETIADQWGWRSARSCLSSPTHSASQRRAR
jgi:hypothetical protein